MTDAGEIERCLEKVKMGLPDLVIKEARAEEARKEVEGWLRRIKMLQ
jgi:hypothetical protein